jgi:hypothetical protein
MAMPLATRPQRPADHLLGGESADGQGVFEDRRVRLAHSDLTAVDHEVEELVDGQHRPPVIA